MVSEKQMKAFYEKYEALDGQDQHGQRVLLIAELLGDKEAAEMLRNINRKESYKPYFTFLQRQEIYFELCRKFEAQTGRPLFQKKEEGKLTISAAERILLKHGITLLTQPKRGDGATKTSRIIFKKDTAKERDMAIREQVLQEIMEKRGVSREEAMKIMANPF